MPDTVWGPSFAKGNPICFTVSRVTQKKEITDRYSISGVPPPDSRGYYLFLPLVRPNPRGKDQHTCTREPAHDPVCLPQ